jgi:D-alanyl-D-alanine dipeptidase
MTRFALICDPRVTALTIAETGDPLTDAAGRPQIALAGKRAPVNPWYSLVRTTVLEHLVAAAGGLADGIRLCLEEAYRPVELQQAIFDDYCRELRARYGPEEDAGRIAEEATKYVARPDGVPPHSTGAAVDVTLLSENGRELDMGSTSDDTPLNNENRNFTYSRQVTGAARRHRAMLVNAMTQAGFENYPAEWWHWSYGDQYWAYRRRRRTSLYGSVSASDIPCRRSPA